MLLIYVLILLFVVLIGYQLFLGSLKKPIIEGLDNQSPNQEYKPYNMNDPNSALILAQQNAGNIEVLKGRIDGLDEDRKNITNLQQQVASIQTQVDGIVQQQADYAQSLAGTTPPEITGTEPETAP